jgi:hypothetical protein
MYYLKHILTITVLSSLLSFPAHSSVSPDGIWADTTSRSAASKAFNYRSINASAAELVNQLQNAPLEGTTSQGLEFFLPLPNGGFERVSAFESPIMAPELAAKLPTLKTYKVTGLDNPLISGRLDASPEGFHGFLNTEQGVVYIEPESSYSSNGSKETYRSFNKSNFPASKHEFKCSVIGHQHDDSPLQSLAHKNPQALATRSSGTYVRTYRLALAATAEYTAAVSAGTPSVAKAQAAIVTAINRINAIYEKEVAIRFSLVDNSNIIFTDAANDGYSNDNGFTLLSENKAKLDSIITPAGYDIGHVFSTGGGGVASLASVCDDESKAQGVTGSYNPIGDPFVVDYVAHEMGHQFGAPHTFNSGGDDSGACDDSNRENHQSTVGGTQLSDSAYEPGSGSTIMAYAGICNPQNLQNNTDPYFHARSLEQIREFVENEIPYSNTQGGSCGTITQTGNTPPSAEAGDNYTIPANTPFALTASGNDVDAADVASLNYTWEQFDLGSKTTSLEEMHTDADTRPIIRSRQGTSSPTRYIPALDAILENNLTKHIGERLPTTDRDLKFRLTVRSGTAGFNQDDMIVTVDKDAGPFRVIEPASASEFKGTSQVTVTWNVANTQLAPVNCSHMDILYSVDGGESFEQTLSTSTPNDGNQQITLPNSATNAARIKVECSDNIFFNVSPGNFTVNPTSLLDISSDSANNNEGDSENSSFTFTITRSETLVGASSVSYSVTGSGENPATAEDFIGNTFPSGSVNFADGESTKTVTINIAGDLLVEPDEGFIVMLSNPESASITTATVIGVITNDDESLSISAAAESKAEGNSGSTAYNFNVVRSGNISGSSTASYTVTSTGDSPATTADFIGNIFPSGTVNFSDGESSQIITVNIAGDTSFESNESFTVSLSNPTSASIMTANAEGTIMNDDTKPKKSSSGGGSGGLLFTLLLPLLLMRRKR